MDDLINSTDFQAKLAEKEKVFRLEHQGETVWLKKAERKQRKLLLNMMGRISSWMEAPLLTPAKKYGRRDSIQYEIKHIKMLEKINVRVPKVLARGDEWLILSDMGSLASSYFKNKQRTPKEIELGYQSIFNEISKLHKSGGYLSQAFVRNITFLDNDISKVGFIDFEDNPLTVSTVEEAQAKDLLYFTSSMARFFISNADAFKDITNQFVSQYDKNTIQLLTDTRRKLSWILKLPYKENLGKDYQKLKLFIEAMS